MSNFFSPEGRYFKFVDKFGNVFWLNILCLVCCIPLFTAGAAVTACYFVSMKIVKDDEGNVTRSFFRSFRQNFRQSTMIWLLHLLLSVILVSGIRLLTATDEAGSNLIPYSRLFLVFDGILLLLLGMISAYSFPLLAKFDNTVMNTLRNAFLLSFQNLPKTLLMLLINMAFPTAIYFLLFRENTIWLLSFLLCFGISGPVYACSLLIIPIFEKYISPSSDQEEC